MSESAIHHLYLSLATLMRRRAELSAEFHPGLSLAGYTILTQIDAVPETRAKDLADLFGLDKSTVSRQLNELEAAGLIHRQGERPGRRGQVLALTPEGHQRLEYEAETARHRIGERLKGWTSRDITAFARMVDRFIDDISQ